MSRKRTRHTTLTEKANQVSRALKKGGWLVHPGPIDARGGRGGDLRVKINAESGRVRIRVAGGGVQELFLYGPVELNRVVESISTALGATAIESVSGAEKI
ncbi:MAG: hypothetical protein HQL52_06460 [Magnetococcales bacterium]|nr:hypothetical protein [Magnetococcales bacterium]